MGWARRLQASQSITATVGEVERRILTANGLAPDEIEQVGLTLELFRKSSKGNFPCQKLMALLEACGASQGAGDIGKPSVFTIVNRLLLAVDRRWSGHFVEDDHLIDELLNQQQPLVLNVATTGAQHRSAGPKSNAYSRALIANLRLAIGPLLAMN